MPQTTSCDWDPTMSRIDLADLKGRRRTVPSGTVEKAKLQAGTHADRSPKVTGAAKPLASAETVVSEPQYQPNELLTIAQVRKQYGLGKTTVYEMLKNGALPAKVIGKRGTRIRREDVDNWVRSLPAYGSRRVAN